MHHLKKWFGFKDWQGPTQNKDGATTNQTESQAVEQSSDADKSSPPEESKQIENEQTIKLAKTTNSTDVISPRTPENDNLLLKYNSQFELWLRQYIPVEKDECAQCKLVTASFLTSLGGVVVYKTYKATHKDPYLKSIKGTFKVLLISLSALNLMILSDWMFKKGFSQKRQKDETNDDFISRVMKEDIQWCKTILDQMKDKLDKFKELGQVHVEEKDKEK